MLANILSLLLACLIISIIVIFVVSFFVGMCIFAVYTLLAIDTWLDTKKYKKKIINLELINTVNFLGAIYEYDSNSSSRAN